MRKNFGAKPITDPQPVFIIASYDETGKPDAMNAAWGGICGDKEDVYKRQEQEALHAPVP